MIYSRPALQGSSRLIRAAWATNEENFFNFFFRLETRPRVSFDGNILSNGFDLRDNSTQTGKKFSLRTARQQQFEMKSLFKHI